jgi:hypothetical protein
VIRFKSDGEIKNMKRSQRTTRRRRQGLRSLSALVLVAVASLGITASASAFDFIEFSSSNTTPAGARVTQAGAHPDFHVNVKFPSRLDEEGDLVTEGNVKDVEVDIPPGMLGNPTVGPRCDVLALAGGVVPSPECPIETQVGVIKPLFACCGNPAPDIGTGTLPLYNVVPPRGVAARFGANISGALALIDGKVRNGSYRIGADTNNVPQTIPLVSAEVVLWGVPADSSHDGERVSEELGKFCKGFDSPCPSAAPRLPFMTLPTNCSAGAQTTYGRADSWQDPGIFHSLSFDRDTFGKPVEVTGCDNLPFDPKITVSPSNNRAASPTGVDVSVEVPQNLGPDSLATAHLKRAEVKLPAGMSISPSAANGLDACSPQQIDLQSGALPNCPPASKLGELELQTPLLDEALTGGAYLAKQYDNPFKSLMAMYLTFINVERGIVIKQTGQIITDKQTGQVTTVFDDVPQLPFSKLNLRLNGGERSTLINPPTCGIYETQSTFVPWSAANPQNPAPADIYPSNSQFTINQAPDGGACQAGDPSKPGNPLDAAKRPFRPKMTAGSVNVQAGASSQFDFKLKRGDNEQELVGITTTLPPGLVASLRGVTECSEATIASIPTAPGTAQPEIERPTCPASSRVGSLNIGAGVGSAPYYTTAQAYLSGPYKGSPLSLTFVAAAKAGPFDFGNVIVRAKLVIDPITTQVKVVSDPVPHTLEGVPLRVQDVRIKMDRPNFVQNPTSCDPMSVDGLFTGAGWDLNSLADDVSWSESNRFQVAGCAGLGFKPKLAFKLKGGTHRGDYPALTATVTARPGDANIAKTAVTLPHSEFLAQAHIRTVCTRVQFAIKACPDASIYGTAKATSPLIDGALEGPVYLRSSSNKLPDLVANLNGRFNVVLSGRIDSFKGGIRNTFDFVPDAPVTKFTLSMQGGKKGLLENSTNLCKSTNRADVRMVGQNGMAANSKPVVVATACKKAGKGKKGKPAKRG